MYYSKWTPDFALFLAVDAINLKYCVVVGCQQTEAKCLKRQIVQMFGAPPCGKEAPDDPSLCIAALCSDPLHT